MQDRLLHSPSQFRPGCGNRHCTLEGLHVKRLCAWRAGLWQRPPLVPVRGDLKIRYQRGVKIPADAILFRVFLDDFGPFSSTPRGFSALKVGEIHIFSAPRIPAGRRKPRRRNSAGAVFVCRQGSNAFNPPLVADYHIPPLYTEAFRPLPTPPRWTSTFSAHFPVFDSP